MFFFIDSIFRKGKELQMNSKIDLKEQTLLKDTLEKRGFYEFSFVVQSVTK